jgi:NAD+ kinase
VHTGRAGERPKLSQMNVILYGREADKIRPLIERHGALRIVDTDPDAVVTFGGDGTLLAAERLWPGVPKVPLRNSRRGVRCIDDPPGTVIERLAEGSLVSRHYLKLLCEVDFASDPRRPETLLAINEFSVHMGRVNSSVRFRMWFDGQPYEATSDGEIIGDGFIVCTPFGSTAYFNQITRGEFWEGIGVAFMYTNQHTNHLVLPESTEVRARITRGPAVLAHDSASEYTDLADGDTLTIRRAAEHATLLLPEPTVSS